MDRTQITQQTSTSTLPRRGELAYDAPSPEGLAREHLPRAAAVGARGPRLDRAAPGRRLPAAVRGRRPRPRRPPRPPCTLRGPAPLLALPPLVMLLFYVRGLYRSRLRILVLDGIIPVVSAVSVAAMTVAVLGMFLDNQVPSQSAWLRAWFFALLGVGLGRIALVAHPALGAHPAAGGQAGADRRRRRDRRAGGAPAGEPLRVRVGARRLPRRGSALCGRGRWARRARARHRRRPRRVRAAHGRQAPDRRLLLGPDARISRLIQRCQELGVEVSVVPRMFDTINDRVREQYDESGHTGVRSSTLCG